MPRRKSSAFEVGGDGGWRGDFLGSVNSARFALAENGCADEMLLFTPSKNGQIYLLKSLTNLHKNMPQSLMILTILRWLVR